MLWLSRAWWLPADDADAASTTAPNRRRAALGVAVGGLLFASGAAPYLVGGYLPTQDGWSDRHQLLLPLGAAVLLFYGAQLIGSFLPRTAQARWLALAFGVLVVLCVTRSTRIYFDYERDWLKQQSMMRQFADLPELQTESTFLLRDEALGLNVFDRRFRFYELSAMLRQVHGQERWFIADSATYYDPKSNFRENLKSVAGQPEKLLNEYHFSEPRHALVIAPGAPISDLTALSRTLRGADRDTPADPVVRLRVAPLRP